MSIYMYIAVYIYMICQHHVDSTTHGRRVYTDTVYVNVYIHAYTHNMYVLYVKCSWTALHMAAAYIQIIYVSIYVYMHTYIYMIYIYYMSTSVGQRYTWQPTEGTWPQYAGV